MKSMHSRRESTLYASRPSRAHRISSSTTQRTTPRPKRRLGYNYVFHLQTVHVDLCVWAVNLKHIKTDLESIFLILRVTVPRPTLKLKLHVRASTMVSDDALPPDHWSYQLTRTVSVSTVSTDATASNLPGPGRIVGNVLEALGDRLSSFINKVAMRRGLGPEAVAQEIRRLRRHHETTWQQRHSAPQTQLSSREEKALKKYCEKLLTYSK